MPTLLFDIDGTLIDAGGAGGSALKEAFCNLFDVAEPGEVPFSGRTDCGIFHSLFRLHGIDCSSEHRQRLSEAYLHRLPNHLEASSGCVLSGVQTLLDSLSRQGDVRLGLLTGNLQTAAGIKLDYFGLGDRFHFGGFGDDHEDRDDVARAAITAAGREAAEAAEETWVIGDTPLDIRCARAINARVLAVATGLHPAEELSEHQPDVLFTDLSDDERVLEVLLG